MLYFLDTSAILNGALKKYKDTWICPLIITELESIKSNINKDEYTKYLAREAVRDIICNQSCHNFIPNQKLIDKIIKHNKFLTDINDHKILATALLLQKQQKTEINFITGDGSLFLFARLFPELKWTFLDKNESEYTEYNGWRNFTPDELEMAALYSNPDINTLNCKINEYAKIYENNELKNILAWSGEKYRPLKYENVKNKILGETLKPLNIEQKMAFDLLQNKEITVKLLQGVPGGGKDIIMIYHALDLIQRGEMNKIIFIRNLVPFKDAPEIGFLKGSLQDKIEWGLGPLSSLLGEETLQMYEEEGVIEAMNLGFIRGCSWDKTILYVSEGQNITGGGYKLLVSRCGKGSELWVNGDTYQTDDRKFDKNNGIQRLINSLNGNKLFGTVKLLKTERSKTAELASII